MYASINFKTKEEWSRNYRGPMVPRTTQMVCSGECTRR